jgi:hypothetical protein
MKILCRYTLDDYIEAHRLHRKRSVWRQWDRVVGFLFLFICIRAGLLIVLPTPRLYRSAPPLLG